jgi:hypothetical protein
MSASRAGPCLKPKDSSETASLEVGARAEELVGDPAAQHVRLQARGVDDHVGQALDGLEHRALQGDAALDGGRPASGWRRRVSWKRVRMASSVA